LAFLLPGLGERLGNESRKSGERSGRVLAGRVGASVLRIGGLVADIHPRSARFALLSSKRIDCGEDSGRTGPARAAAGRRWRSIVRPRARSTAAVQRAQDQRARDRYAAGGTPESCTVATTHTTVVVAADLQRVRLLVA
jgi:hypothetical protein